MREEGNNKHRLVIKILIAVIIVLLLVLAYLFLVAPGIDRFATNNQIAGANSILTNLINTVSTQGYVAIPLGNNQTLILVPYTPPEAAVTG